MANISKAAGNPILNPDVLSNLDSLQVKEYFFYDGMMVSDARW